MAPYRKDPLAGDTFDEIALQSGKTRAFVLEVWNERAAIRQYLGNMTRMEADLAAVRDTRSMLTGDRRP